MDGGAGPRRLPSETDRRHTLRQTETERERERKEESSLKKVNDDCIDDLARESLPSRGSAFSSMPLLMHGRQSEVRASALH